MKFKTFLLGCAAVLVDAPGSQAADLPVAEVDYVRICDVFGEGYYYIPGTDTCLRVSGRVRAEMHYRDSGDPDSASSFADFNNLTTSVRGYARFDARTETAFGLVRTYISLQMNVGDSSQSGFNRGTNYDQTESFLDEAFVELSSEIGIFTAGHTSLYFDFFGSNTYGTRVFIDDSTIEQTLFAYTRPFGDGFSATLSLEDPATSNRRRATAIDAFDDDGRRGRDDYEGQVLPDVVANIRVDKTWGSAQVMGVLHHINDNEGLNLRNPQGRILPTEGSEDADGLGWAVGAGASINLPARLNFAFQANYTDGALGYITNELSPRQFNQGFIGDFSGPSGDDTNNAWNIRAGLTAEITKTVALHLDGSYTDVEMNDDHFKDFLGFDYDYDTWAVVANAVWTPVPGLSMGPEIGYSRFDFDDDDLIAPDTGIPELADFDHWGAMFRI